MAVQTKSFSTLHKKGRQRTTAVFFAPNGMFTGALNEWRPSFMENTAPKEPAQTVAGQLIGPCFRCRSQRLQKTF